MKLIELKEFKKLKLSQFLPSRKITELKNWEFDNKVWVGERYGFTNFLRPAKKPDETWYISLSLTDLPRRIGRQILDHIGLPLSTGDTAITIAKSIGRPKGSEKFVADRETLIYRVGRPKAYQIDCTIHETDGLIYLGIRPKK